MADGLWYVDIGQLNDNVDGKGPNGTNRNGEFIVCVAIFPVSLDSGRTRARLTI